jgi:hypothetical protein
MWFGSYLNKAGYTVGVIWKCRACDESFLVGSRKGWLASPYDEQSRREAKKRAAKKKRAEARRRKMGR